MNKKELGMICFFLFLQTILFIIVAFHKEYIHMDEAYSYGLASYNTTEIQNNVDFYNTWHDKEYYEEYLSLSEQNFFSYWQVYENQKNDVHPPLYYFFLRIVMSFSVDHYSKWPGIFLNIFIHLFITIFLYLIFSKLFSYQKNYKFKAILFSFFSSITIASISNVIYIRMYTLLTLWVVITTFLHLELLETKINRKLFWQIFGVILAGALTHYYYFFFLLALYVFFIYSYVKRKDFKSVFSYTLIMILAAIFFLIIFPHALTHMFFRNRGQGVIHNFLSFSNFSSIISFFKIVNQYVFHNLLFVFFFFILLGVFILKFVNQQKIPIQSYEKEKLKIIFYPTIFYFIIVSYVSPWVDLRYIFPICAFLFFLIIYTFYILLHSFFSEKLKNTILGIAIFLLFISPFIFAIEPTVLYSSKKNIVQKLSSDFNLPTIYFFYSKNNRFLDDILLFSILNESYIAKDMNNISDNLQNIFNERNLSNGILVFINEGQEHDKILESVLVLLDFNGYQHLEKLNACDIYYFH